MPGCAAREKVVERLGDPVPRRIQPFGKSWPSIVNMLGPAEEDDDLEEEFGDDDDRDEHHDAAVSRDPCAPAPNRPAIRIHVIREFQFS